MKKVTWNDVKEGDIVYIDNYEDGKYPMASPAISGPFMISNHFQRRLVRVDNGRYLHHYPNNLLVDDKG